MLERLIGGQRPAEGIPVEGVLDGELERPVEGADHLRELEDGGDLQLPLDVGGDIARPAEYLVPTDGHLIELHLGKASNQVEPVGTNHRHPRSVGRHQ